MELTQILELLSREYVPGDEMTEAFLEDAVECFGVNRTAATRSIRELQANDPSGFIVAAVRLLSTRHEKSQGVQYVAGLLAAGDLLIDALMDERILTVETATALARHLTAAEPLLDVRLVNKMMANAGGDIRAVKPQTALRVLTVVDSISDCSRLSSALVQLLRHPSPHLRSKIARLLGKANLNLNRIKSLLASDDARVRANALESLWGSRDPKVLNLLQEASGDKHGRVAINALLGLCKAGERDAYERLKHFAASNETSRRAGAAWAMGQIGETEFRAVLDGLAADPEESVRKMAAESLKKLPVAAAPAAQPSDSAQASDSAQPSDSAQASDSAQPEIAHLNEEREATPVNS